MKKYDKKDLMLKEKNMYKAFIILALPVLGSNLLKSLHDIVDTYFIGGMENSVNAQAGISISWPLINILLAFNIGLSVAGVAVISQLLGAGKEKEAKKYAGMLLSLALILGVVVNILLFILAPGVMKLMGAEGETLRCAVIYLRIRAFEMTFVFIFSVFQAIRQAKGDTITPVILSTIAVILNIILTGIFIKVLGMGIEGAALSTVIGQAAIAPVCLYKIFSKREEFCVEKADMVLEKENLKKLVSLALPSAASQALSSLGFLILQAFILDYGDVVASAFSIGNKVSNLLLMPTMAVGSILAAYVGQNIGAGNKQRAMKSYKVGRNISFMVSVIGCIIIFPFREKCIELLSNDAQTIEAGVEYVFWVLLTQPLMALFQNFLGVFNGSGNTKYSFIIASARLWVIRLPLILFFKNFTDIGRSGIWYAMVISNFIILFVGKMLFRKVDFEAKIK